MLLGRELKDHAATDRSAAASAGGVGGVQVAAVEGSAVQITLRSITRDPYAVHTIGPALKIPECGFITAESSLDTVPQ